MHPGLCSASRRSVFTWQIHACQLHNKPWLLLHSFSLFLQFCLQENMFPPKKTWASPERPKWKKEKKKSNRLYKDLLQSSEEFSVLLSGCCDEELTFFKGNLFDTSGVPLPSADLPLPRELDTKHMGPSNAQLISKLSFHQQFHINITEMTFGSLGKGLKTQFPKLQNPVTEQHPKGFAILAMYV